MSNFDKFPHTKAVEGEILPRPLLERGEMRTIEAEIDHIQAAYQARKKWNEVHGGWEKEPTDEIESLRAMRREGFKYILRLPRVNEADCIEKYGRAYDKSTAYFEFINILARRNGITRLKHLSDSYYVFDRDRDAKLLTQKLIEQQEKVMLEVETIEGS